MRFAAQHIDITALLYKYVIARWVHGERFTSEKDLFCFTVV
jgi:hypothetical protein